MKPLTAVVIFSAILLPNGLNAQNRLPADSMEIGRMMAQFVIDGEADSLFAYMRDEARERVGSADGIRTRMEGLEQLGDLTEVIEEKYVTANGDAQFWHTAIYSNFPLPFLMRFVIDSEGMITGIGMSPASQAPPTDDDPEVI